MSQQWGNQYGGYGPHPFMFMPPPRDPTTEDKLRELDMLDAYRTKLRKEIKEEKPEKKDTPKKWHDNVSKLTVSLAMVVTFPFWALIMINMYSIAFKQLGIALRNIGG